MADLELSGGLQAVINGVNAKTGSGYADTDLIQLYANDGTPNGKIARSALMSCVKDSLGTLLNQGAADLGTSLAKIPALNSGGTLGSATVANLASVLGGVIPSGQSTNTDADTILESSAYSINDTNYESHHLPSRYGFLVTIKSTSANTYSHMQMFRDSASGGLYVRFRVGGTWGEWYEVALNVPAFYKNYADLSSLQVAVAQKYTGILSKNGGSVTKVFNIGGIVTFSEDSIDGVSCQFMFGYNAGSDTTKGLAILNDPSSMVGRIITITKSSGRYDFTITNISTTKDLGYILTLT